MDDQTKFVARGLACIVAAEEIRRLRWYFHAIERESQGAVTIPPPSHSRATGSAEIVTAVFDIIERADAEANVLASYAPDGVSAVPGLHVATMRLWGRLFRQLAPAPDPDGFLGDGSCRLVFADPVDPCECHEAPPVVKGLRHAEDLPEAGTFLGMEWSDELRDDLRDAIEDAPEDLAERIRGELRGWIREWIPRERWQSIVDEAERPMASWGVSHGLRFTPRGLGTAIDTHKGKDAAGSFVSVNDSRDAWLYKKDCEGVSSAEIIRHLKPLCDKKGWSFLDEWKQIRKATTRYANRHGLSHPPKRQQFHQ